MKISQSKTLGDFVFKRYPKENMASIGFSNGGNMYNSLKLKSAQEAQKREEFTEALKLFGELIKESPELAVAYEGAAHCLYYLQKHDEALEMINAVLEIKPVCLPSAINSEALTVNVAPGKAFLTDIFNRLEGL